MTKDEAHHLLNKRKQGLAVPQYIVNRALVVSGDISMACSPCQATRVEGTSMAQGAGTGVMPDIPMAWDNHRFNQHHEGAQ
jgi:hypothetical protein